MVSRPIFGLLFHVFSTPRETIEFFAASGLMVGTVFYMHRIARTSMAYAIDDEPQEARPKVAGDAAAPDNSPKYRDPFCAG